MKTRKIRESMTEENIKDLFEMFDQGLSTGEIMELTGRGKTLIYAYKKKWKKERESVSVPEIPKESEPEPEKVQTGLADSDYAKAYLSNDPAVVRSSFEIKRFVQIRSRKTGIMYEMDPSSERKSVKITLGNGQEIEIELGMFEKFVDEGVDVYLELKRGA